MTAKKRKLLTFLVCLTVTVNYLAFAAPIKADVGIPPGVGIPSPSPSLLGKIELPKFFKYGSVEGGLGRFLNNIFILITAGAGIFALFNFLTAGFAYMGAKGDEKKMEEAWAKIWQSLVGLLIIGLSFLIAALAGIIFFGDAGFILHPKIYGPE